MVMILECDNFFFFEKNPPEKFMPESRRNESWGGTSCSNYAVLQSNSIDLFYIEVL